MLEGQNYFPGIFCFIKKHHYLCTHQKNRGVEQLVARRAHNPKVTGSSPVPATKKKPKSNLLRLFLFEQSHELVNVGIITHPDENLLHLLLIPFPPFHLLDIDVPSPNYFTIKS